MVLVSGTHILTTALIPVLSKYEDPRVVSPPCLSAMRSEPSKGFSEGFIYDLHWNTIIIKRISGAPIYRTRWEHRALYNNTNNTHAHSRMYAHTHARTRERTHTHRHAYTQTNKHASGVGIGTAVKKAVKNMNSFFKSIDNVDLLPAPTDQ